MTMRMMKQLRFLSLSRARNPATCAPRLGRFLLRPPDLNLDSLFRKMNKRNDEEMVFSSSFNWTRVQQK